MNSNPGKKKSASDFNGNSTEKIVPLLNKAGKPVSKEGLKEYLMDSNEVLKLLNICRTTLYNWRKKHFISFSKIGGRIYFEVADVYQMLSKCKQPIRAARA